jgi:hypothetical protein
MKKPNHLPHQWGRQSALAALAFFATYAIVLAAIILT